MAKARKPLSAGETLAVAARAALAEATAALSDRQTIGATVVHEARKAMKRWRALLRLLEPAIGDARRMRTAARDIGRELASAREPRSALDALDDLRNHDKKLPAPMLEPMSASIEGLRAEAEQMTLTPAVRDRLRDAVTEMARHTRRWPIDQIDGPALAAALAAGFRKAKRDIPADWLAASDEALHEFRQRVVIHRYQMELAKPLWPKLGKVWIGEAQRLRERLGAHQDLSVLRAMSGPKEPLEAWRARLLPAIAARQRAHRLAAARIAGRLFAETPKAFQRRIEALYHAGREHA